jgi:hypothetical protein
MPQNIKEPNNLMPPELCAGSNYTEFLNGTWGWADTDCQAPYPFMCKVTRAWLRSLPNVAFWPRLPAFQAPKHHPSPRSPAHV